MGAVGCIFGTFLYGYMGESLRGWIRPSSGVAGGAPMIVASPITGEPILVEREEILSDEMEGEEEEEEEVEEIEETVTVTTATPFGVRQVSKRTVSHGHTDNIEHAHIPGRVDLWKIFGFGVLASVTLWFLESWYPWQLEMASYLDVRSTGFIRPHAEWFQLHFPLWSPIEAGFLIGLLQIPSLLVTHGTLLTNTAYASAATFLADTIDKRSLVRAPILRTDNTFNELWGAMFMIGSFFGAFMSSYGASAALLTTLVIANRVPRILALLGGTCLMFGAKFVEDAGMKMGLTGMSDLSVSTLAVAGGAFAGTVGTALML